VINQDKFKIQRKPLDELTVGEVEDIRKAFDILEQQNADMLEFIKELYNTECTTSAFDYQCIIKSKINKFKHRG
jgi:hypothetical protein